MYRYAVDIVSSYQYAVDFISLYNYVVVLSPFATRELRSFPYDRITHNAKLSLVNDW